MIEFENKSIKPVAVTSGEPAGIGPDLCLLMAQTDWPFPWLIIGDPDLLQARAQLLNLSPVFHLYKPSFPEKKLEKLPLGHLWLLPVFTATKTVPGQLNSENADYVLTLLERATQGCLTGEFSAMVTAPLHKGIICDAGLRFTGHTEWLAERTQSKQVVMMLAAKKLRVALATTHLPLRQVPDAISFDLLLDIMGIMQQDLTQYFGVNKPFIKVCGLNPHAGENGHLGHEDIKIITPAIHECQRKGWRVEGPYPADTLFTPHLLKDCDAVLAMYHDQGLPVLKHMGFGQAVNITLGLPIIRTSVDHGTALDLAGTSRVDSGSLIKAMQVAANMAMMHHLKVDKL